MRILLFIIVFSLPFCSAFALKDYDKKFSRAKNLYQAGNYFEALKIYLELYKRDSTNCNLCYQTGACYLKVNKDHQKALYFLQRATRSVSQNYNEESLKEKAAPLKLFKLLGDALHLNYQFDDAIAAYEKFLKGKIHDRELVKEIKHKIEQCKYGKELYANPVKVKLLNSGEGINTAYQEYAPKLTADGNTMIFTAKRPENTGGKTYDGGQYFEDVYISKRVNGKWQKAVNLGSPVNTIGNEAAVSISADGQKMLIYKDDMGDGNIYSSQLEGNKWSVPVKLNHFINSAHWEPAACLSADGNTIYFVSDRPGGYGGTDIYKSTKTPKGDWGRAVNLGSTVNSEYDEHSPFIHADGKTLYFSSKGHKGIGGFDVFCSTAMNKEATRWSEPVNIGYPISTTGDDAFFTVNTDKKSAHYSSSYAYDDAFGEKDIYEIVFENTAGAPALSLVKGTVNTCDGTCSNVEITVADNKTGEVLAVYHPNTETSQYSFVLPGGKSHNVTYEAEGYMFCSVSEYSGENYREKNSSVCLQLIKEGAVSKLNNIFFDFDDSKIRPASKFELERLFEFLIKHPELKIEISGYADSKGSDAYNMKLSQARAQSVVDYLIAKGIERKRLVAAGYGAVKSKGKENIKVEGGINPSDRRVEMKILELKK